MKKLVQKYTMARFTSINILLFQVNLSYSEAIIHNMP